MARQGAGGAVGAVGGAGGRFWAPQGRRGVGIGGRESLGRGGCRVFALLVGEKWLRDGDPSWVSDSPTAHLPQGFAALMDVARC